MVDHSLINETSTLQEPMPCYAKCPLPLLQP